MMGGKGVAILHGLNGFSLSMAKMAKMILAHNGAPQRSVRGQWKTNRFYMRRNTRSIHI